MKTNKRVGAVLAILILAAIPITANAQSRITFGLEFGTPPPNGYYESLAGYYSVPYRDICVMHDAGVADEDIPPILYIYTHSQYSLRQIYSLRLRGATWDNLSNWCGVPLYKYDDDYYSYRSGPPYGNAYGYYRHGPGKPWTGPGYWYGDGDKGHGKRWKGEHGRGGDRERDD